MNWPRLWDLVFPRACAGCGAPPGDTDGYVCWDCLSAVRWVQPPYCAICGDPVYGRVDAEFVCWNCTAHPPAFDLARSAVRYDGVVQRMLRAFKYHQGLWLQPDLLAFLQGLLRTCPPDFQQVDAVTFVPLYPRKLRERSYNQAAVLAEALSRALQKPLLRRALIRIRSTRTQTHLTAAARATNVKGAFEVASIRRLREAKILLVDDVMTTGATVNECARALRKGGAAQVLVMTVARG